MIPEDKLLDQRPDKEETLIVKQQEKIKKLNHLNGNHQRIIPPWWLKYGEVVSLLTVLSINLSLLWPFFGKADTTNSFSAPMIPGLSFISSSLIPDSYGIRFYLLIFMLFLPLTFYLMIKEISQRKLTAFISSLIVSLPVKYFLATRVNMGLLGEDGAHIASLTLIPLVCLLLLKFMRYGNYWHGVLCALGMALTALTSVIGLIVLLVFALFTTFSEILLGQARVKGARFSAILVMAVGLSAFWYNPNFVLLIINSPQGELLKKVTINLLPVSFFIVPILGVFGFLIFENRSYLQPVFLAIFFTINFLLLSFGAGISHPSPSRFLPALGISFAFLMGVIINEIFDFFLLSPKIPKLKIFGKRQKLIAFSFLGLVVTLLLIVFLSFRSHLYIKEGVSVLNNSHEDKRVGIWDIRKKNTLAVNIFGYPITFLTILSVLVLRSKLKKS